MHEAKYLGYTLNSKIYADREVRDKTADTKATWLKLQIYWKANSNNSLEWKLNAFNSVIKSKLLYGLETVHLTKSLVRKLAAFQLRGIRKISNMLTTYIDRSNTNIVVIQKANEAIKNDSNNSAYVPVKMFSDLLWGRGASLMEHTIRSDTADPLRIHINLILLSLLLMVRNVLVVLNNSGSFRLANLFMTLRLALKDLLILHKIRITLCFKERSQKLKGNHLIMINFHIDFQNKLFVLTFNIVSLCLLLFSLASFNLRPKYTVPILSVPKVFS